MCRGKCIRFDSDNKKHGLAQSIMDGDKSTPLSTKIMSLLRERGAMKAKDIARALDADPTAVNQALYGPLEDQIARDADYSWSALVRDEGWIGAHPLKPAIKLLPSIVESVPECPDCGKSMRLKTARVGPNPGNQFWGCSAYPNGIGTRQFGSEPRSADSTEAAYKASALAGSVDWRESKGRTHWSVEYVPVGANSSLFATATEANPMATRLLAQTFLMRSRRRAGEAVDQPSAGLLAVAEKILLRGRLP